MNLWLINVPLSKHASTHPEPTTCTSITNSTSSKSTISQNLLPCSTPHSIKPKAYPIKLKPHLTNVTNSIPSKDDGSSTCSNSKSTSTTFMLVALQPNHATQLSQNNWSSYDGSVVPKRDVLSDGEVRKEDEKRNLCEGEKKMKIRV